MHREPYEAALSFADKPSQKVLDYLKENGFRWTSRDQVWTRRTCLIRLRDTASSQRPSAGGDADSFRYAAC